MSGSRINHITLPSAESIIAEYKKQGKQITRKEALSLLEQIKKDVSSGHLDAMENLVDENKLEGVSAGIAPFPTRGQYSNDDDDDPEDEPKIIQYEKRPN